MSRTLHRGDNVSGGAREKGRERERDEQGRERKCISLPRDTSRDETNVFSSTAFVFLEVHRIFFPNLLCLVSPSLRWKNEKNLVEHLPENLESVTATATLTPTTTTATATTTARGQTRFNP